MEDNQQVDDQTQREGDAGEQDCEQPCELMDDSEVGFGVVLFEFPENCIVERFVPVSSFLGGIALNAEGNRNDGEYEVEPKQDEQGDLYVLSKGAVEASLLALLQISVEAVHILIDGSHALGADVEYEADYLRRL